MKFLIDECLSEVLAKLARERGHEEASHIRWIGKGGAKDWELLPVILEGDWMFVTKNAYDFRGPSDAPGAKGEYVKAELHAGLVCLNGRAIADGRAVSVCATVRSSSGLHCAGVETARAYRGRGHAPRAVAVWANLVRSLGAEPFYATTVDNLSSQKIAWGLGLELIASEFSIYGSVTLTDA